jgi:hypothetical protein
MKYSELKKLLEGLENGVQVPAPPSVLSGVRNNGKSQVQAFALHNKIVTFPKSTPKDACPDDDQDLPVVVAVGANYGQGLDSVPRDNYYKNPIKSPSMVEASLGTCENNLRDGLKACGNCSADWYILQATSSANLRIPEKFYFVMTNFCIWITDVSWQSNPSNIRASLLVGNPAFSGQIPSACGDWPHLEALAAGLYAHQTNVLWVGHGLGGEVFALLRLWNKKHDIGDWILLPNLSHRYGTYGKTFP